MQALVIKEPILEVEQENHRISLEMLFPANYGTAQRVMESYKKDTKLTWPHWHNLGHFVSKDLVTKHVRIKRK